jgi:uncharacterized protein
MRGHYYLTENGNFSNVIKEKETKMKKILIVTIVLLAATGMFAQDITGKWNGLLEAGGQKLRIVFNITATEEGLQATMDSPDQGAFGLEVSSVNFEDGQLELVSDFPAIEYAAELKDGVFDGVFKQAGYEFPLVLQRKELAAPVYNRPQEPKEPYPYRVEEVVFANPDAGIELAGTLTLPEGDRFYPAVVLISGSGPQNRDEELLGHKPFLVIADHLTRNGIAVLRYDDRGVGGSGGDHSTATSVDFASDAASAVEFLKERPDIGPIGLIGHSECGLIAPMVAVGSGDVSFIVLLAGPGLRGDQILMMQEELIMRGHGTSEEDLELSRDLNRRIYDLILESEDIESIKPELTSLLKESLDSGATQIPEGTNKEKLLTLTLDTLTNDWMVFFIKHDPVPVLEEIRIPVLALNGSNDLQVPSKENLEAIAKALEKAGNKDFTIIEYPGLNHLFQESETGMPDEYIKIEQTFSPEVLDDMTNWILERTIK